MPVAVVKLGSSVVAREGGELRLSVVARVCEELATLHRSGVDVVVVTSGAIARGVHLLDLPVRPNEIAELQAASAMGQGRLYRTYDDLLREQGVPTAQILLTFFDMSARTHYLNARRTLRTLLGWRVVPVINENDTTTTDEHCRGRGLSQNIFGEPLRIQARGAALLPQDFTVQGSRRAQRQVVGALQDAIRWTGVLRFVSVA